MRDLRASYNEIRDRAKPPVLCLLDEFPQLGYMQPIEEALLYIGSYAVKFWFFIQDLSQMQEHYDKRWRQFLANCGARTFFGVSDQETAKLVSEMSGQTTVKNRGYNANVGETDGFTDAHGTGTNENTGESWQGWFGATTHQRGRGSFENRTFSVNRSINRGLGANLSYVGRPLFMPDEVLRMPFGAMISFVKGMPAIKGQILPWNEWMPERRLAPPQKSGI